MGYSIHIPLPRGRLKIKSGDRLRTREFNREAPTLKLLGVYFVWESSKTVEKPASRPPRG